MSILSRGPSKDAFYQISVHLVSGLTGEDFLEINQSETRNACGGHVCKMDLDKMCNFNRGSSIDTLYQVSVHLAKGL
jgi:hypothetical protein